MRKKAKISVVGIDDAIIGSLVASAISNVVPFIKNLLSQGQAEIVALDAETSQIFRPIVESLFQKYPQLKNFKPEGFSNPWGELWLGIQGSIDGASGRAKNDYQANLDCLARNIILTMIPYEPSLSGLVQNFVPRKAWNCTEKTEDFTRFLPIPQNQYVPTNQLTQGSNPNQYNQAQNQGTGLSFQPSTLFYALAGLALAYFMSQNSKKSIL
jgi:hypothetical protein